MRQAQLHLQTARAPGHGATTIDNTRVAHPTVKPRGQDTAHWEHLSSTHNVLGMMPITTKEKGQRDTRGFNTEDWKTAILLLGVYTKELKIGNLQHLNMNVCRRYYAQEPEVQNNSWMDKNIVSYTMKVIRFKKKREINRVLLHDQIRIVLSSFGFFLSFLRQGLLIWPSVM